MDKWRLQFSESSHSNGIMVLNLTSVSGEPITVSIDEASVTSKNGVTKVVVNALKALLPKDAYYGWAR